MQHRRIVIVGVIGAAVLVAVSVATINYLDGPYPERRHAERLFESREPAMRALYERLNADGLSSIKCYPDTVYVDTAPKGIGKQLTGSALQEYLTLCSNARATMAWRVERGFLFYVGGSYDEPHSFNIAFVRLEGDSNRASCESMTPEGDFGACAFGIAPKWELDYEWVSDDFVHRVSDGAT